MFGRFIFCALQNTEVGVGRGWWGSDLSTACRGRCPVCSFKCGRNIRHIYVFFHRGISGDHYVQPSVILSGCSTVMKAHICLLVLHHQITALMMVPLFLIMIKSYLFINLLSSLYMLNLISINL